MPHPFEAAAAPRRIADGLHTVQHNFGAISSGAAAVLEIDTFLQSAHYVSGAYFVQALIRNTSRFDVEVQEAQRAVVPAFQPKAVPLNSQSITIRAPNGAIADKEITADIVIRGCRCGVR